MKKISITILKITGGLFLLLNIVIAFHAYKFTHFYDRGELSIKKENEKNGWDKTKELLFGFNFEKQANNTPDTSYKSIILTTSEGLKLEAWEIPVQNARGTVALFHGHGGKKSGVSEEAAQFRALGYNTLLVDFRAHGNSEGNTCTIGYLEAEDVKLAYEYLRKKSEKNIILWGISLGAATITKAIHDFQLKPSGIILEMPFGSLQEAVEGRMKIMHLPAEPFAALLTFWGGIEHGFWAFNLKPCVYATSIKCPVLLQWGRNDPRVSENETNAIFQNIHSAKTLIVYDQSGHESLCKNEHGKWVTSVTNFLK